MASAKTGECRILSLALAMLICTVCGYPTRGRKPLPMLVHWAIHSSGANANLGTAGRSGLVGVARGRGNRTVCHGYAGGSGQTGTLAGSIMGVLSGTTVGLLLYIGLSVAGKANVYHHQFFGPVARCIHRKPAGSRARAGRFAQSMGTDIVGYLELVEHGITIGTLAMR